MLRTRIAGSTALFQTLHHIGTGRVQCRPKPEQYPREHRGYEGESEDDTTHIHFIETRNTLRAERLQSGHACMRKENPSGPSGESEQKAFGQQLPNETGSSGTECDPEDNLPAPYGISREKKAGDVRARYQQHESNRSLKHQQGRPDATDENTLKRLKAEAPPGIGIGVFASKTCRDRVQFSLRLRDSYAPLEKPYRAQEMRTAAQHSLILQGSRKPQIGVREDGGVVREDADNRARLVVEGNRRSDYVWIPAKPLLPQMMAEDYNLRLRCLFVG